MSERLRNSIAQDSVWDIIRMIQLAPVQSDLVPDVVINQVLNRIPLAHLTIEKSLKYRIQHAGGKIIRGHGLHTQLDLLRESAQNDAEFLDQAFDRAVSYYDIDATTPINRHYSSLHAYLKATGREKHFAEMRYWSLDQQYDQELIPRIHLLIHVEILYAAYSVFFSQTVLRYTLPDRVDEAIKDALAPESNFAYIPGTSRETDFTVYRQWIQRHDSYEEIIQDAIRCNFETGHFYTNETMRNAVDRLCASTDFAVQHLLQKFSPAPEHN